MNSKVEAFYLSEITKNGQTYKALALRPGAGVPLPIFRFGKIDHKDSVFAKIVFRLFLFLGWIEMLAVCAESGAPND